jgi:hypothetical protein
MQKSAAGLPHFALNSSNAFAPRKNLPVDDNIEAMKAADRGEEKPYTSLQELFCDMRGEDEK